MTIVLCHNNSNIKLYGPVSPSDDSSIHSTVATTDVKQSKPPLSVRFSAAPPRCYENTIICKEDVLNECWLRPRDYKRFRAAALEASQQIIAVEQRNRAPFSYQRVLERTLEVCCQAVEETMSSKPVMSESEFVHLQRWFDVASSRIGLEKWSIRKIANDKSVRRQTLNQVVRDEKKRASSFYHNYYDSDNSDEDEQEKLDAAEYLAETCARISRPSRLMARTLAIATAAAVQKDDFFDDA